MSDGAEARRRAETWAEAWNRRDLDALLGPIADDVTFVSPLAARILGSPRIEGKTALRRYWVEALAMGGPPRFTVEKAIWDGRSRTLLIFYVSERKDVLQRRCEVMQFDQQDRQTYGEALHGAEERRA